MGLFSPVWMTDNKKKAEKAIAAVDKIADQDQLKEIAFNAPLRVVQDAAVAKISDQEILTAISEYRGNFAYMKARKKLDLPHRKQFVLTCDDINRVSEAIMDGLDDDAFLEESVLKQIMDLPCVKKYRSENTREDGLYKLIICALANIRDQKYLYGVVMGDVDGPFEIDKHRFEMNKSGKFRGWSAPLCEAAVWNITDEDMLFEIANDSTFGIWRAAVSRMHDKDKLQKLIEKYGTYYDTVGWCAEKQLTDGTIFYSPLKNVPLGGFEPDNSPFDTVVNRQWKR